MRLAWKYGKYSTDRLPRDWPSRAPVVSVVEHDEGWMVRVAWQSLWAGAYGEHRTTTPIGWSNDRAEAEDWADALRVEAALS